MPAAVLQTYPPAATSRPTARLAAAGVHSGVDRPAVRDRPWQRDFHGVGRRARPDLRDACDGRGCGCRRDRRRERDLEPGPHYGGQRLGTRSGGRRLGDIDRRLQTDRFRARQRRPRMPTVHLPFRVPATSMSLRKSSPDWVQSASRWTPPALRPPPTRPNRPTSTDLIIKHPFPVNTSRSPRAACSRRPTTRAACIRGRRSTAAAVPAWSTLPPLPRTRPTSLI